MTRARFLVCLVLACGMAGCGGDDGDGDGNAAGSGGGNTAGSGGSGGGGSCTFQACGGDVVGEWTVADVCFQNAEEAFAMNADEPECADAFQGLDASGTGTYEFDASGNAVVDATFEAMAQVRWTADCISALAGGTEVDIVETCPMLESAHRDEGVFETVTCEVVGDACECDLTLNPQVQMRTGGYEVQGNNLIDEVENTSEPFCVEGDTLTVSSTDAETGLTGVVVLMR